jgi:hypothetical protein
MGRRGQLQEDAVFLQDEALAPREFVILPAKPMLAQPLAVGLVGRKTVDGIDAVGRRRRPLMRREIANQVGTARRDGLTPVAGILLERLPLERVDLVADEAGDGHLRFLLRHIGDSLIGIETSFVWSR